MNSMLVDYALVHTKDRVDMRNKLFFVIKDTLPNFLKETKVMKTI
jgi:hypothetical protein